MNPINNESINARQRDRILARIEKANALIDEYENIILTSNDPKEKLRAQENIDSTRHLIPNYQAELDALGQSKEAPSTPQPVSNTLPIKEEFSESGESNTHNVSAISLVDDVQDLDRRLKDLQRGIDDLKRGQDSIYQRITEAHNHELKAIFALIRQGAFAKEEMTQTLEMIGQAVSTLEENQESLSLGFQKVIADANSALSSEASLQGKLELTLPIIPLLLDYKVEFGGTDSVDLNKLWENAQNWWKSLTTRASERGNRELLNKYSEEFRSKESYLIDFESRINQGNTNIFIRAESEFGQLARLALEMNSDLEVLNLTTKVMQPTLQRMEELARSISHQAHSAAATLAAGNAPTSQTHRIKQNMLTLHRLVRDLLAKLEE